MKGDEGGRGQSGSVFRAIWFRSAGLLECMVMRWVGPMVIRETGPERQCFQADSVSEWGILRVYEEAGGRCDNGG